MAARSIASLITDEILTRVIGWMRRRASVQSPFNGIVVPIDDLISHRVIATGSFEATQLDGIAQILDNPGKFDIKPRRGAFVDVGANIGLFTIALHRNFDRTIAIEANPFTFAILQANVALREISNVSCICVAASDEAGSATLSFPANGNLGWATLNDFGYERRTIVARRTLDDLLSCEKPVGLIKIDVEHYELEVLQGSKEILKRDRPIVLFESLGYKNTSKCAELLLGCGYTRFLKFTRRGKKSWWRGLTSGFDVSVEELDALSIQAAPLVCAV